MVVNVRCFHFAFFSSFPSSSLAFFCCAVGRCSAGILCIWKLVLLLSHFTSTKHSALIRHGTEEDEAKKEKNGLWTNSWNFLDTAWLDSFFLQSSWALLQHELVDTWHCRVLRFHVDCCPSCGVCNVKNELTQIVTLRISNITRYGDGMAQFTDG